MGNFKTNQQEPGAGYGEASSTFLSTPFNTCCSRSCKIGALVTLQPADLYERHSCELCLRVSAHVLNLMSRNMLPLWVHQPAAASGNDYLLVSPVTPSGCCNGIA